MAWEQIYDPVGKSIVLSALVAGIPLYCLFYMLAVRRAKGQVAAAVAVAAATLLSILVWRMPTGMALSTLAYGALFGIFPIIWIVVTAIWVYNMTVESGQFEIVKSHLATITDDRRLQAIFIAFAFGSFIEGTAGFGTPVAITAAMLVGLGFNPIYAAGICLLANTAPVAFGAIGLPVIVAAQVSSLDVNHVTAIVGRQLPFLSIIVPIWLSVTMCGFKRSLEVMPALIVGGVCFAVPQFLLSNFHGPYLPDILSALCTIVGLGLFLRVWKPSKIFHFPDEAAPTGPATHDYSGGQIFKAWLPWLILTAIVLLWGLKPVVDSLNAIIGPLAQKGFEWPGLHNLALKVAPIVAKPTAYGAMFKLNLLSTPGTSILFAGIISVLFMPNYGYGKAIAYFFRTVYQMRWPIFTIAMILSLAQIMNYSGLSASMGLALASTGALFPFFAPILGWLGVFLTGSDTSSNALFGALQKTTAQQIGVDPNLCVAANSSGGVTGKMISPQSISVATAATGLIGKDGDIFRFTLWHSVAMCLVICLLTLAQAYVLKFMLP